MFAVHKPASIVLALAQTTDRYVWMGTPLGLFRYDGARFVKYSAGSTPGLPAGSVAALAATDDRALWVGTTEGIAVYHEGVFWPPEGLAKQSNVGAVRRFVRDAQGWMWIATSQGLFQTRGGQWVQHGEVDGLPSSDVLDLVIDPDGGLWVQTSGGRAKRIGDRFVSMATPAADTTLLPLPLLGLKVVRDNPIAWNAFSGAPIASALIDSQNVLWSARPFAGGLLRWTPNRRDVFTMRNGLGANVVTSLLQDTDGGMWAGTLGGGATYIHESRLRTLRSVDGFPGDVAYSVVSDASGGVWVTASGGVAKIDSQRIAVWPLGKSLPLVSPRWITTDARGSVWIADVDGNVARLADPNAQGATFVVVPTVTSGIAPSSLFVDETGRVLLSLVNGAVLRIIDDKTMRSLRAPDPGCIEATQNAPCPAAFSVVVDRSGGGVWAGTFANGVWQVTDGGTQQVLSAAAWNGGAVLALLEDDAGVLWVGTKAGLVRFDGKATSVWSASDGMPATEVHSLIQDGAGHVWGTGPAGIFMLQTSSPTGDPAFISFGLQDGLASEVMSSGFSPSAARSTDGRLWFASDAGLVAVEAPEHVRAPVTPIVLIESVTSGSGPPRVVLYEDEPVQVESRDVRVAFSAPAFFETQRVRLKYRVGRDPDGWVEVGPQRFAHLLSLPAGTSLFAVSASRLDSGEVFESARVRLIVPRDYYEQPIFIVLIVVAASAFSWALRTKCKRRAQLGPKHRSPIDEPASQHNDPNR